jgi:N-carbamoyl-L-amino-acid hydrolase
MAQLGITHQTILGAGRDPHDYLAFLECHIEQGARLEKAGIDIGVVTSIIGIRNYWLNFQGEAAHAGTQALADRADAFWGASAFVQRARKLVQDRFTPGVMNCGLIQIAPGAFNIVPGHVRLGLEFRHGTEADLDMMQNALLDLAREVATEFRLALAIEPVGHTMPAQMDSRVMNANETAAESLGLSHTRLISLAGHDTQAMSRFVPSGMFFIPSVNGISHNPREYSHERDVINGANVLVNTLLDLAKTLA